MFTILHAFGMFVLCGGRHLDFDFAVVIGKS
jgi:hypothetical protein